MKVGKLGADRLQKLVLDNIQYKHREVLVHAGIGEDSAVIDFGEEVLVISSDPITGAVKKAGFLAVHVNANDLAAAGACPLGMQVVLLVPETCSEEKISTIIREIHQTAAELEIEIIGGHTEVVDTVSRPLIVITGIGKTKKDKYVATADASPGDQIILTKGVGIEGMYILASDFRQTLQQKGVSVPAIEAALDFEDKISVIPEGLIAVQEGASALHDITEGGLYGALEEISQASGTGFKLDRDKVPVPSFTREICSALNLDPLGLLSSGSMLITAKKGEELVSLLDQKGINAWVIGKVTAKQKLVKENGKKREFNWTGEDELWKWLDNKTEEKLE